MVIYEFPVNERIRSFLRLENLYKRARVYSAHDSPEIHHSGILTIFEMLEVTGRVDLKSEVIQELEKQKTHLGEFKGNPSVEEGLITNILEEVEDAIQVLLTASGKTGQAIRQNEWLSSIRQRTTIPGGVCQFDLPAYHFWLNGVAEHRKKDLGNWLQPFSALATGIIVILKILRKSGQFESSSATGGNYQKSLSGKVAQLIRLKIKSPHEIVPEVSANKYLLNIRFKVPNDPDRKQTKSPVDFDLSFCNLP